MQIKKSPSLLLYHFPAVRKMVNFIALYFFNSLSAYRHIRRSESLLYYSIYYTKFENGLLSFLTFNVEDCLSVRYG